MSTPVEPHFQVPSSDLAAWIEKQGKETWWNVDGDTRLTDRLTFPCPGDELADELRRIDRSLMVFDPKERSAADGALIGEDDIDGLVDRLGNYQKYEGKKPAWADNRVLYCQWTDGNEEWMLSEDRETSIGNQHDQLTTPAKK